LMIAPTPSLRLIYHFPNPFPERECVPVTYCENRQAGKILDPYSEKSRHRRLAPLISTFYVWNRFTLKIHEHFKLSIHRDALFARVLTLVCAFQKWKHLNFVSLQTTSSHGTNRSRRHVESAAAEGGWEGYNLMVVMVTLT
jgi:hypothetical protein